MATPRRQRERQGRANEKGKGASATKGRTNRRKGEGRIRTHRAGGNRQRRPLGEQRRCPHCRGRFAWQVAAVAPVAGLLLLLLSQICCSCSCRRFAALAPVADLLLLLLSQICCSCSCCRFAALAPVAGLLLLLLLQVCCHCSCCRLTVAGLPRDGSRAPGQRRPGRPPAAPLPPLLGSKITCFV